MKKKELIKYGFIYIFLMLISFCISYFANVKLIDGTDLKTGKDVGGLVIDWNNIVLSLFIVSLIYLAIVWEKIKR